MEKMLKNIIKFNNTNQSYNFILTCVTNFNIPSYICSYLDRIFKNSSSNKVHQIIFRKYFVYDILVQINTSSCVDIQVLINNLYRLKEHNLLVSNDKYNLLCRIYNTNFFDSVKNLINLSYVGICRKNKFLVVHNFLKNSPTNENYNNVINYIKKNGISSSITKNKIRDFGKVSIIITCFNSQKTIEYSVKSVINQTYKNLSIIIVDDCSSDNTVTIVNNLKKKYNINIKLIQNESNKGCYFSKNIGLKNLDYDTEFICFHDSDDISKCCRIEKQVYFMKKKKFLISACLGAIKEIIKMPMISIMIRKSVFEKVGYFNIRRFGSDEEYIYRLFCFYVKNYDWNNSTQYTTDVKKKGFYKNYKNFGVLKENLYLIFQQEKSLTKIYGKNVRHNLSRDLINKYKNIIKNNNEELAYLNFEDIFEDEQNSINDYDYESEYSIAEINYSIDTKDDNKELISDLSNEVISLNSSIYEKNINIFVPEQVHISKSLNHLKSRFCKKYNLNTYNSVTKPSLFFGIYNKEDIEKIKNHRSEIYIIWGGTDIDLEIRHRYDNFKKLDLNKIKLNYSISEDISNRLTKLNLNFERIKLNLVDKVLFKKLNSFGKCIFIYNGFSTGNENLYGKNIYEQVVKKLPQYKYIFSNTLNLPYEKMPEIYSKCFIGLRLTKKDGNANMVQEMLQMGIPIIHNGDYNTIKWSSASSVIESINTVSSNLKNNSNSFKIKSDKLKRILIIFEKDLTVIDGSMTWLFNIIEMFKMQDIKEIKLVCKKKSNIINDLEIYEINDIKLDAFILSNNFDCVIYRPCDDFIKFDPDVINKVALFLNFFNERHINKYKQFKNIFTNSILVKDELNFNGISNQNIEVIPPMISSINNKLTVKNRNTKLKFIYSGTLKKEYLSYELIKLFYDLSKSYSFEFKLIYGKIKLDNSEYDNNLKDIINKISLNKNFIIQQNCNRSEILNHINNSDYGIVTHNKILDKKQQSTKLIEYLSKNCLPIKSLNFLNCGYFSNENILTFENLDNLKDIVKSILNNEIDKTIFNINFNKLSDHLYKNNFEKFILLINKKESKGVIIQKEIILEKNLKDVIITNNIRNRHYADKIVFIDEKGISFEKHAEIICKFIKSNNVTLSKEEVEFLHVNIIKLRIFNRGTYGFFLDNSINNFYKILIDTRIFDISYDNNLIYLSRVINTDTNLYSLYKGDYLYFNLRLKKNKFYFIEFNIKTKDDGYVILNILDYKDNIYQDINRNLHVLHKNNNQIIFTVKIFKDDNYQFRIKPSNKNTNLISFLIEKLKIHEITNINNICNTIKVINMNKEINKYHDLSRLLESNYILSEREEGIDGFSTELIKQYNLYQKMPYNETEKKIGRKLLASPGALGYLYSMRNIFKKAILENHEYILICDDDIALISNFIIKFNSFLKSNTKPRLLMLGSSQWNWENLETNNNFYSPNNTSNGSFANIYHRSTFDKVLEKILEFNSPFDCGPMKSIFDKNCYVSNPNLVIAQLEKSSIIKTVNKNRNYDKFKWDIKKYKFAEEIHASKVIYKNIKKKQNKMTFVIGITTFNRSSYLKDCIDTLLITLNNKIDYILIFVDGCSTDNNIDVIKSFTYKDNISLVIIQNPIHFIYRQSNSILKYSLNFEFDFGFLMNDDLIFHKFGWDELYYNVSKKENIDHLVFFGKGLKNEDHYITNSNKTLESFVTAENCQGALFTFTKNLIKNVGFFDEKNFKIRGHSHIDFTLRCCRLKYNNINYLYDVSKSNDYITLNNKLYISTFNKLPLLLRELHKVDIHELDRRNLIIRDKSRKYLEENFTIIELDSNTSNIIHI